MAKLTMTFTNSCNLKKRGGVFNPEDIITNHYIT